MQEASDLIIKWDKIQIDQDYYNQRPYLKEGATIVCYKEKLYLYGGIGK